MASSFIAASTSHGLDLNKIKKSFLISAKILEDTEEEGSNNLGCCEAGGVDDLSSLTDSSSSTVQLGSYSLTGSGQAVTLMHTLLSGAGAWQEMENRVVISVQPGHTARSLTVPENIFCAAEQRS